MPVLDAQRVYKAFSDHAVLENASLTLRRGERVGLVGSNGSGKSTLARILAGIEPADQGTISQRRGATVRYLAQEPALDPNLTAREFVASGLTAWSKAKARYEQITAELATASDTDALLSAQAEALAEVERYGGWAADQSVESFLSRVGIKRFDQRLGEMSGGERRRVALAELLVAAPDLAILDEPTNHLDAMTVTWLEEYLEKSFVGALLLITHDRYVLDRVVTRTLEIENAKVHSYDGGWELYLTNKAERQAIGERTEANRQNLLRRELEWLSRQPKARTGKQKARIGRAEAAQAAVPAAKRGNVRLDVETVRLGGTILELHDLTLDIAGRRLIDGLTLHLTKGERIGILGANGSGKTSLLRCIRGELTPTDGRIIVGKNTRFAYFDQGRQSLDLTKNVAENVAGLQTTVVFNGRDLTIYSYLEQFLLSGPRLRQPVGSLSGGEQARVVLAKLLLGATNLLLLDEPTNDLDVDTLGALEELLVGFDGSVLVVTHDRYFLDRVATSILAFEEDGRVVCSPGNYTTYWEGRQERQRQDKERARGGAKDAKGAADAQAARESKPRAALSYAERLELKKVMQQIEKLEANLAALQEKLADPELYAGGSQRATPLMAEQRAANAELAQLMARWEELESKASG